jgi:hypothetical protein
MENYIIIQTRQQNLPASPHELGKLDFPHRVKKKGCSEAFACARVRTEKERRRFWIVFSLCNPRFNGYTKSKESATFALFR